MPEIYEPVTSVIEKDNVKVTLSGSCNMCGWCCEKMCTDNVLTDDGKCRYLKELDLEGHRLCAIQEAVINGDDKFLKDVSEEEMAYYKRYCESFPASIVNDSRVDLTYLYFERIGWPPPQCGFTLEKD